MGPYKDIITKFDCIMKEIKYKASKQHSDIPSQHHQIFLDGQACNSRYIFHTKTVQRHNKVKWKGWKTCFLLKITILSDVILYGSMYIHSSKIIVHFITALSLWMTWKPHLSYIYI